MNIILTCFGDSELNIIEFKNLFKTKILKFYAVKDGISSSVSVAAAAAAADWSISFISLWSTGIK